MERDGRGIFQEKGKRCLSTDVSAFEDADGVFAHGTATCGQGGVIDCRTDVEAHYFAVKILAFLMTRKHYSRGTCKRRVSLMIFCSNGIFFNCAAVGSVEKPTLKLGTGILVSGPLLWVLG